MFSMVIRKPPSVWEISPSWKTGTQPGTITPPQGRRAGGTLQAKPIMAGWEIFCTPKWRFFEGKMWVFSMEIDGNHLL